jgi:energy-coupling factor transporter ATP-binding protein EcfA2
MYIDHLEINNLKCFPKTSLSLQHPGKNGDTRPNANVNLLLGNNGAGKSTVLKALALATLARVIGDAGYVPYYLVRHGADLATMRVSILLHEQETGVKDLQNHPRVETATTAVVRRGDFERLQDDDMPSSSTWDKIYLEDSPAFMILGYGATRRVDASDVFDSSNLRKVRRVRYQRVAGLFENHIALTPLAAWLPRLFVEKDHPRLAEIRELFRVLLPPEIELVGSNERDEIEFKHRNQMVPFGALSDGYQAYIGWTGDLLYHLTTTCPPAVRLAEMTGVVLVDEIDLHLHPSWQRNIASTIANALPMLQFVFTTHSPLVAGTLEASNIYAMEDDPDGSSRVVQLDEQLYGRTAEEVLNSPYFGVDTSRAPGFEDQLRNIADRAWEGDPTAAVDYLKALTTPPPPRYGRTTGRTVPEPD